MNSIFCSLYCCRLRQVLLVTEWQSLTISWFELEATGAPFSVWYPPVVIGMTNSCFHSHCWLSWVRIYQGILQQLKHLEGNSKSRIAPQNYFCYFDHIHNISACGIATKEAARRCQKQLLCQEHKLWFSFFKIFISSKFALIGSKKNNFSI